MQFRTLCKIQEKFRREDAAARRAARRAAKSELKPTPEPVVNDSQLTLAFGDPAPARKYDFGGREMLRRSREQPPWILCS